MKKPFLLLTALLSLAAFSTKGEGTPEGHAPADAGSKSHAKGAFVNRSQEKTSKLTSRSSTTTGSPTTGSSEPPPPSTEAPSLSTVMNEIAGLESKKQGTIQQQKNAKDDAIKIQINEIKASPKPKIP